MFARRSRVALGLGALTVASASCGVDQGVDFDAACLVELSAQATSEPAGWPAWEHIREIAHRGYVCCEPENTLEAVDAALAAGAQGLEVDVRTTADGVPVLMHDETMDRTTGSSGLVGELSYQVVRSADACPEREEQCVVPTVEEVLDRVDGRALVLLDLKDAWTCKRFRSVVDHIRVADAWGNVAIISSIEPTLEMARLASPTVPLAYYWFGQAISSQDPLTLAAGFGSAEIMVRAEDVLAGGSDFSRALSMELPVMAWTARTPSVLQELLATPGVTRVLSDVPFVR